MELSSNERQMVENWLANPDGVESVSLPVQVEVTRRKWIDPAPYTGEFHAVYVTHVGQVRGETIARGEPSLVVTEQSVPGWS